MQKLFSRVLIKWAPILVATSGVFLFAYWAVQQDYRMSANDPQIQMAEDGAAILSAGGAPADVVPHFAGNPPIDITTSLSPWIAVFDASGTPLESTARIGTMPLSLPQGVFDTASWKHGYGEEGITRPLPGDETRFSWQYAPAVRQAVVLVRAQNGDYVASGRSLAQIEEREAMLTEGAALLWGATELATLIVILVLGALS